MHVYFNILLTFILIFGLVHILAYFSGVLKTKIRLKQNMVFLISIGLAYVLFEFPVCASYLGALGFIFGIFNIYLFLTDKIKKRRILLVIVDFTVCLSTLFLSTYIVAILGNLLVKDVIHERFEDGSYTFFPGYLDEMIQISLFFSIIVVCYKCLYSYFMDKWEERQSSKVKNIESERKNIEMQFETLQAKVNPHFLYNSLNSIAGLATVDGDKTRQMALALSRFFRYSMNREQEIMITIKEETDMIRTYLEIEKIRFGNMLNYEIDLPDNIELYKIPRMLLQPIVENCMKHGMKGDLKSLKVDISFSLSDQMLTISVKDNGKSFADDFIPGYGIKSVYEKLDLLCPDNYKVELITYPEKDFRIYLMLC